MRMPRSGVCRVCFEEEGGDLIAPCQCKGTSKWVHRECLNKWRASGANPTALSHCCQCQFEYTLVERSNSSQVRETSATTVAFAVFFAAILLFAFLFSTLGLIFGAIAHACHKDVWLADAVLHEKRPRYWLWTLYLAGVFVPCCSLGAVFVLTFLRAFPGRCWEETNSFLQAIGSGSSPSGSDWWNFVGNFCCIYWMVRGVAYALSLNKTELYEQTLFCLAVTGGFVGGFLILFAVAMIAVVSYREYSKISAARALTNKYDVEDLADPEDMGDVEEQSGVLAKQGDNPTLRRELSEQIVKIYGDDASPTGGSAAAAGDAVQDSSRLERMRSGLQRGVARAASGLLGAAPPPVSPTVGDSSRSQADYGSAAGGSSNEV